MIGRCARSTRSTTRRLQPRRSGRPAASRRPGSIPGASQNVLAASRQRPRSVPQRPGASRGAQSVPESFFLPLAPSSFGTFVLGTSHTITFRPPSTLFLNNEFDNLTVVTFLPSMKLACRIHHLLTYFKNFRGPGAVTVRDFLAGYYFLYEDGCIFILRKTSNT